MGVSRRRFLASFAATGAAALDPVSSAAPYHASVHRDGSPLTDPMSSKGADTIGQAAPLRVPATMKMGSGAPLGGIGTGFVEIRADGGFHEWQIFNSGSWAMNARSTTAPRPSGPQYLRFLLRTKRHSDELPKVRRLYLNPDENDLYTLPFVQEIESIDYSAWFPMTGLDYNDPSIPVRVSAAAFSPFIPGNARASGTPGFHMVFTLENAGEEPVEASLAAFLDNPLASALSERRLTNQIQQQNQITTLHIQTSAQSDFPSGIGDMCLSVFGGNHSFISGTFQQYAVPGTCRWESPRVNYMIVDVLQEFVASGTLPDTSAQTDPTLGLPTPAEFEAMTEAEARNWINTLSSDALLARVFRDAQSDTHKPAAKDLLKEVIQNLRHEDGKPRFTWGTSALASWVRLAPHEKLDIRFTLSWFFPHHLTTEGREMGHMYSNWFRDAADVNHFLCDQYVEHRKATETFARTLADTSLGDPLSFAWSGQLATLVTNTWWTKDGNYAIWEGLGCCGLSTMDVDYQGSFPVVALFPELKLAQMKQIMRHQNGAGQVPHTYNGDLDRVDDGFKRVDMNPQFVMMVWRDYLWTGDRDYLSSMWPHVQKAMAYTQSLDGDGDGLPDRDTAVQTYDQWRMRGTHSYVASLWIGALKAAVQIATEAGKAGEAERWSQQLVKASASFDRLLFNGEYYNLWVDAEGRDELCMTDQVSGEWFTSIIGLPSTISRENLTRAIDSIFKYNFNSEFGLHNATAPRRGAGLLALNNLQAGGLWSGIEFAFASFLMTNDRYADGVKIVDAVHRRYLRAGRPWNHIECGDHYSRAMSSWATLLAAAGFRPDVPNKTLAVMPTAPGDFRIPWVTASCFGTLSRKEKTLSLTCTHGQLELNALKLRRPSRSIRLGDRDLDQITSTSGSSVIHRFSTPVVVRSAEVLNISE